MMMNPKNYIHKLQPPEICIDNRWFFRIKGVNSESLLLQLSQHGICASAGSACMYGSIEPSHVMLAIGRSRELASGSLRLTFSAENTMEEAELICSVMPGIISKLRGE